MFPIAILAALVVLGKMFPPPRLYPSGQPRALRGAFGQATLAPYDPPGQSHPDTIGAGPAAPPDTVSIYSDVPYDPAVLGPSQHDLGGVVYAGGSATFDESTGTYADEIPPNVRDNNDGTRVVYFRPRVLTEDSL